jgi:epoxyqueuosine reductase QueG
VLVDENDPSTGKPRPVPASAMAEHAVITRRHGSWVVLGTLVTEAVLDATPPLGETRRVPALRRRVPDRGTRRGQASSIRLPFLSGRSHARRSVSTGAARSRVYSCDCQDVCPWNRGVESAVPATARETARSLVDWLEADDAELRTRYDRLCPTQRPALPPPQCARRRERGGTRERAAVASYAASDDELLRERALWALDQIEERT